MVLQHFPGKEKVPGSNPGVGSTTIIGTGEQRLAEVPFGLRVGQHGEEHSSWLRQPRH